MATVYSDQFTSAGVRVKSLREPHNGLFYREARYTIAATGDGTAAADIIQMIPVRAGTTVVDLAVYITDVDADGSPAHTFDVGDGDDVDRFIDGSTKGQTSGVARLGDSVAAAVVDDAAGYTYTVDDTIDIKVVTAAATKAAGVVVMVATLSMEDA